MASETISHYQILEELGRGGMGTVYKARDTKLDRFVALKFLPPHLSASEEDKARFIQEARAASALNSANVCTIYDVEEADGKSFIVMEYVDGQTLREREKSISFKQAIEIGIQVSEGLAAAHDKGIVHRDIKPENIMIRKDGVAQIMDFGLAKLQGVSRLTKEGSTVGTAGYMSPEQIQGLDVDHRSDIFSLGVVLYELLAGELPFKGVHETALSYEIVNVDPPPMSSVKPDIDQSLDAIVLECLEKDPNERMQSARQVAIELKRFKRESSRAKLSRISAPGAAISQAARGAAANVAPEGSHRAGRIWIALGIAGWLALAALLIIWRPWLSQGNSGPLAASLSLEYPDGTFLSLQDNFGSSIAISPDGKTIVFEATSDSDHITRLYVRSIDSHEAKPVAGTEGGLMPSFSPDGKWVLFVANGKLQKVASQGGAPVSLAPAPNPRDAAWGNNGEIIYAPDEVGGLYSVGPSGGAPKPLTTLDSLHGEISQRFPDILPGGKAIIFTSKYRDTQRFDNAKIVVERLDNHKRKVIIEGGTYARYAPGGRIIYVRGGSIYSAPFDLSALKVTGSPTLVAKGGMMSEASGAASYSFSSDGVLVYLPGGPAPIATNIINWVSFDGSVKPLLRKPGPYYEIAVSPSGDRLALGAYAANNDIWIYNILRGTMTRLTFGGANHDFPLWSGNGKEIIFSQEHGGAANLYEKPADGSGNEVELTSGPEVKRASSWSPDGKTVAFVQMDNGIPDIWMLPMTGDRKPYPFVVDQFNKQSPQFSPDGHWLLYMSTESGNPEIYMVPFPKAPGKWQVSSSGGMDPFWSPDGRYIYYVHPQTKAAHIMGVRVSTSPSVDLGPPRKIFDLPPNALGGAFDASHRRLAVILPSSNSLKLTRIDVALGWSKRAGR